MLTRVLAAVHDADPRVVVGRVPPDLPVQVHSTQRGAARRRSGRGRLGRPGAGARRRDLHRAAGRRPAAAHRRGDRRAAADRGVGADAGRGLPGRGRAPADAVRGLADRRPCARRSIGWPSERGGLHGASVRELMEYLRVAEVSWRRPGPPPWFDCDTDDDLRDRGGMGEMNELDAWVAGRRRGTRARAAGDAETKRGARRGPRRRSPGAAPGRAGHGVPAWGSPWVAARPGGRVAERHQRAGPGGWPTVGNGHGPRSTTTR